MDDYNVNSLTDTRNEYCALFINRLTPLMIQGITSIFNEACKLCADNDEDEKYLMTFQNFLARISKWNQDIIQTETDRIKNDSGCSYLEDLLTCVHVTQLKLLTAVRVGQKQKKVDINIPKLEEYVHKSYIEIARRVYKNAFLFELSVSPLVRQKHMREIELLVRESLLNVIRDNMPVEQILRAYIDETTEEDVYEVKEDTHEVIEDVPENALDEDVIRAQEEELNQINNTTNESDNTKIDEANIIVSKSNNTVDNDDTTKDDSVFDKPIIKVDTTSENSDATIKNEVAKEIDTLQRTSIPSNGLAFNDTDNVKTFDNTLSVTDTNGTSVSSVDAPKTIERLEEISTMRNEQRRLDDYDDDDDDEEDKITIFNDTPVKLDVLDVNNLNKSIQLNDNPILGEITTLA